MGEHKGQARGRVLPVFGHENPMHRKALKAQRADLLKRRAEPWNLAPDGLRAL